VGQKKHETMGWSNRGTGNQREKEMHSRLGLIVRDGSQGICNSLGATKQKRTRGPERRASAFEGESEKVGDGRKEKSGDYDLRREEVGANGHGRFQAGRLAKILEGKKNSRMGAHSIASRGMRNGGKRGTTKGMHRVCLTNFHRGQ